MAKKARFDKQDWLDKVWGGLSQQQQTAVLTDILNSKRTNGIVTLVTGLDDEKQDAILEGLKEAEGLRVEKALKAAEEEFKRAETRLKAAQKKKLAAARKKK